MSSAEFRDCGKEWNIISDKCVLSANTLSNTYFKAGYIDNDFWGTLTNQTSVITAVAMSHVRSIDELLRKLTSHLIALQRVYTRLSTACRGLQEETNAYLQRQLDSADVAAAVLEVDARGSHLQACLYRSKEILAMYRKELVLKTAAIDALARGATNSAAQEEEDEQELLLDEDSLPFRGNTDADNDQGFVPLDSRMVEVHPGLLRRTNTEEEGGGALPPLNRNQLEVHLTALMLEPYLDPELFQDFCRMLDDHHDPT